MCMRISDSGCLIFHEPATIVSYVTPRHFLYCYDLQFFLWRWADSSAHSTLNHFQQKYNIADDDTFIANTYSWVTSHRRIPARVLFGLIRRLFRGRIQLTQWLDWLLGAITPKEMGVR
jgi:hypothetical protein